MTVHFRGLWCLEPKQMVSETALELHILPLPKLTEYMVNPAVGISYAFCFHVFVLIKPCAEPKPVQGL